MACYMAKATRDSVLCFDGGKGGILHDQVFKHPSPKTKQLSLFKPLPPVPSFGEDKVTSRDVVEITLDNGMKSLVGARIDAVPFDPMFADADETEVSAIHEEDHDSLRFKGQFNGLATSEQAERAKKVHVEKVAVYIGQAHHLNNLILHKDMHVCPTFETTEYNPISAPTDSDIGRCISYAHEKSGEAAEMARTPAEEALRKEAYYECSMARLEGIVVGSYRYFQGHLTVEEYHEGKMCICWQLCECSKMCTRFADLICPCADKIETNCR